MNGDWLDEIEVRVREAAAAARRLRTENATLKRRIAELEKRLLAAAQEAPPDDWVEERQEVRRRLEDLVAQLEALVEEPAGNS